MKVCQKLKPSKIVQMDYENGFHLIITIHFCQAHSRCVLEGTKVLPKGWLSSANCHSPQLLADILIGLSMEHRTKRSTHDYMRCLFDSN
jgi:hypothetical protein